MTNPHERCCDFHVIGDYTIDEFVPVECIPQNTVNSQDLDDWEVKIDQDVVPDWFKGKGKKTLIDGR